MSLQKFHILFITLATLCFVGFGFWCFGLAPAAMPLRYLAGVLGVILGFTTAFYGMWFYRTKIRDLDISVPATAKVTKK